MSAELLSNDDPGARIMLLATRAEQLVDLAAAKFCAVVRDKPDVFEEALMSAVSVLRAKVGFALLGDAAVEAFEKAAREKWEAPNATSLNLAPSCLSPQHYLGSK